MGPSRPLGIVHFDPAQVQHCVKRPFEAHIFWTMLAMESQKSGRRQSKQREHKRLSWSNVPQTQYAMNPGSRNNKSFLILNKANLFALK